MEKNKMFSIETSSGKFFFKFYYKKNAPISVLTTCEILSEKMELVAKGTSLCICKIKPFVRRDERKLAIASAIFSANIFERNERFDIWKSYFNMMHYVLKPEGKLSKMD
jgi:hypothetical protein